MGRMRGLPTAVTAAAVLWFYMFSPWTGHLTCFWLNMSISAVLLTVIAVTFGGFPRLGRIRLSEAVRQLIHGLAIAVFLWCVFWVGDKVSGMLFGFADAQIESVYMMGDGTSPALIGTLLLLLIGPAEEYFWRGYVQRTMSGLIGPDKAMILTVAVYTLIHIWSMNAMLVLAALAAGAVWGLLYRLRPSLLPALVISHAVWDAAVFVIFPVAG